MHKKQLKKLTYLIIFMIAFMGLVSLDANAEMTAGGDSESWNGSMDNQSEQGQQMKRTVAGTVSSMSESRDLLTLQVDGREVAVNIVGNTEFWDNNNNRIDAASISTNDRVSITGTVNRTDMDGLVSAMTADRIMKM